jgi:hypothetical protein
MNCGTELGGGGGGYSSSIIMKTPEEPNRW